MSRERDIHEMILISVAIGDLLCAVRACSPSGLRAFRRAMTNPDGKPEAIEQGRLLCKILDSAADCLTTLENYDARTNR